LFPHYHSPCFFPHTSCINVWANELTNSSVMSLFTFLSLHYYLLIKNCFTTGSDNNYLLGTDRCWSYAKQFSTRVQWIFTNSTWSSVFPIVQVRKLKFSGVNLLAQMSRNCKVAELRFKPGLYDLKASTLDHRSKLPHFPPKWLTFMVLRIQVERNI
jgi:hypothetical protein